MVKHLVLFGALLFATGGMSESAQAQSCSECETAIKDKLIELDARLSRTNALIKDIDRNKLDPLTVKVDTLTTKLVSVETKLDELTTSDGKKGAVVIDFGDGIRGPFDLKFGGYPDIQPKVTEYCRSIRYADGKALSYKDFQGGGLAAHQREARRIVCFM